MAIIVLGIVGIIGLLVVAGIVMLFIGAAKDFEECATGKGVAKLVGALLLIAVIAVSVLLLLSAAYYARDMSTRSSCQSNMHQLDLALSCTDYPPNNIYPSDLAQLGQLNPDDVSPDLFVCPSSPHEPGELEDAMAWTDCIYLANQSPATPPGKKLIICPYHLPKGYNALDTDHSTRWIQTNSIQWVIDDTNYHISKLTLDYLKSEHPEFDYSMRP